jgi:NAD(P)-dependent dehydrogenase (short-subunit alcohol dehydrogenase family)
MLGHNEFRLADDGYLELPVFVPRAPASSGRALITDRDVVVVVGGGRGIAAECALQVARRGAAIALVGRSAPDHPAVAETLARAERLAVRCRYVQADVLDPASFASALAPTVVAFGPATVLIHAAGVNEPRRVAGLDAESVSRTLAPKTKGLDVALQALSPGLRQLITFGSIIGCIGLEGEAHYALANAMQTAATKTWASAGVGRHALAIEWSVWGGAGMGESLGLIERLSGRGVDAISVDDALVAFERMIMQGTIGAVAVTSRFGPPPDLLLGAPELPALRFVDEPRIHFPGVELVVETVLSYGRDPYLGDHVIDGQAVLPAVMSVEAMAEVASALAPLGTHIEVTGLAFVRAVSVPRRGATRIRIAALRTEHATTEVQLFAEDDNFAAPCAHATFTIGHLALRCRSIRWPPTALFPRGRYMGHFSSAAGDFNGSTASASLLRGVLSRGSAPTAVQAGLVPTSPLSSLCGTLVPPTRRCTLYRRRCRTAASFPSAPSELRSMPISGSWLHAYDRGWACPTAPACGAGRRPAALRGPDDVIRRRGRNRLNGGTAMRVSRRKQRIRKKNNLIEAPSTLASRVSRALHSESAANLLITLTSDFLAFSE